MSQALKVGKGPSEALATVSGMADSIPLLRRRAFGPENFTRGSVQRPGPGWAAASARRCLLLAAGLALPAGIALAAAPLGGGHGWWRYPLAGALYLIGTAVVASGFFRARN